MIELYNINKFILVFVYRGCPPAIIVCYTWANDRTGGKDG